MNRKKAFKVKANQKRGQRKRDARRAKREAKRKMKRTQPAPKRRRRGGLPFGLNHLLRIQ